MLFRSVGNIDEAILLREKGIQTPILIFAGNLVEEVADLYIRYSLIPTIFSVKAAQAISRLSKAEHPVFLGICLVYNKNTQNCRGDSPKLQREIPQ